MSPLPRILLSVSACLLLFPIEAEAQDTLTTWDGHQIICLDYYSHGRDFYFLSDSIPDSVYPRTFSIPNSNHRGILQKAIKAINGEAFQPENEYPETISNSRTKDFYTESSGEPKAPAYLNQFKERSLSVYLHALAAVRSTYRNDRLFSQSGLSISGGFQIETPFYEGLTFGISLQHSRHVLSTAVLEQSDFQPFTFLSRYRADVFNPMPPGNLMGTPNSDFRNYQVGGPFTLTPIMLMAGWDLHLGYFTLKPYMATGVLFAQYPSWSFQTFIQEENQNRLLYHAEFKPLSALGYQAAFSLGLRIMRPISDHWAFHGSLQSTWSAFNTRTDVHFTDPAGQVLWEHTYTLTAPISLSQVEVGLCCYFSGKQTSAQQNNYIPLKE